jgi:hypothetical protein
MSVLATGCEISTKVDGLVGSGGIAATKPSSPSTPVSDVILLQTYGTSVKTGYADTTFASPMKVQLLRNGLAYASETISFSISSGTGGSLSASTVTTDSDGFASVFFTAGATPQTYEVLASWNSGARQTAFVAISSLSPENSATKVIKVLEAGAGSTPEVGSASLDLNSGTLSVKAALFDFATNSYISDIAVSWSAVGGGFNSNDFTGSITNTVTVVFRPTRAGSTLIQATYVGSDADVIGPVDTTGAITVSQTLVPGIIQRTSGNNQTQVANDVLTDPIKVRILTNAGVPIPGLGVNFTAGLGGGSVITPQPVLTDADGYASSIVQFATVPGTYGFTATVVVDSSLNISFTETATTGTPDHLAFSTQPAGANAGNPFVQQPVVLIKDAFNNTVTNVPTSVTLSVGTGAGALSGTLTKTSSSGLAAFTDLVYSIAETGVVLHAVATGLSPANSSSFTVNAFLGACSVNDSNWSSTQGGCKDIVSGLVWSTMSDISYTWHESVWDNAVGSVADANDYGRTNDYESGTGCAGTCDISTSDYCKSLSYNGYSDWRLPALAELSTAYSNGAATHLSDIANANVWSASTGVPVSTAKVINLSTGVSSVATKSNLLKTYCVRGGWSNPARVSIAAVSNWVKINQKKHGAKLQILDGSGNRVNASGTSISIETSVGAISGTTSGSTGNTGEAVLSEWQLDTLGAQTLSATSSGLLAASTSVTGVGAFGHNCATNNSRFATSDGGCKDLSSNLVWSNNGSAGIVWADVIWDSIWGGNTPANADDNGRVNDYVQGKRPSSWTDYSFNNYCHDLSEGGSTDWRPATYSELVQVLPFTGTYFGATLGNQYWSSSTCTYNLTDDGARSVRLSDGYLACEHKSWARNPICVRSSAGVGTSPISHSCLIEDSSFATALGGCRDLSTGRVWSRPVPTGMVWAATIWDSELSGNARPDSYDSGRSNDYVAGTAPSSWSDYSYDNYCHDLVESGYSDWRVPTYPELVAVGGATKGGNHFAGAGNQFWSSSSCTYNLTDDGALTVRLSDGYAACEHKSWGRSVVCVRDP